MKLIGYRFKNHEEENWAYTYDLDEVSHGKGIKEYGYVEPIYIDDEKNHIQVEIPKLPRWLSVVLSEMQTKNYLKFARDVSSFIVEMNIAEKRDREKLDYIEKNKKTIDLAIALGVWEIEKNEY